MAVPNDIVDRVSADLQRAKSRAEQARDSLAAAELETSELEAFLRTLSKYAGASVAVQKGEHAENREPAKLGSRGRELVDAAMSVIRREGRPQQIGPLTNAVLADGHEIGGRDQKSNLAGYLSRDPRLCSRGRGIGWDLVKNEEAATEPDSEEAASSPDTGGTSDGTTLALPGHMTVLPSYGSQVP